MNAFDEDYYHEQFEKNNIYQGFELNKTQLHQINHELLDYLKHGQGEINITSPKENSMEGFFNEKEIQHLIEVRQLIQTTLILFYFFITIFILLCLILYFRNRKNFTKNTIIILMSGCVLNIIFILIITTMILTNFSNFFTNFHLAVFESNTWLLNPATDNLIKMFPQQFFYSITKNIFYDSIIISIILFLILFYIYTRYLRNNNI